MTTPETTRRRELDLRLDLLEKAIKEIRQIIEARQTKAGPQSHRDSHTQAKWQGRMNRNLKDGPPGHMKPTTTFRVSCENKALYFKVLIWETLADLRAANPGNRRTLGLCKAFRVLSVSPKGSTARDRFKPILGEMHFARRHVTVGILSHECCHAMMTWAEERRCIPLFQTARERESARRVRNGTLATDDPEERCCYVLGNMVRQIIHQLYRRGILK